MNSAAHTVMVTKLDRLARSSRDLHNILHQMEELSCGFVSLGESWCDTTTDVGRLMLTRTTFRRSSFTLSIYTAVPRRFAGRQAAFIKSLFPLAATTVSQRATTRRKGIELRNPVVSSIGTAPSICFDGLPGKRATGKGPDVAIGLGCVKTQKVEARRE
jgi:hypothetical protein